MAMAIEAGRDQATPAIRAGVVAQRTTRERRVLAGSEVPGKAHAVRYLYDEDGRILAEAFVGPEED